MPDNGNLTDKLSVEISASVDPAIRAIDSLQTKLNLLSGSLQHFTDAGKYKSALDNMASGFERLNQVVSGIDTSRIEAFSKSLSKVSGSITGFTKAAEKIEQAFTPVKKEPETVADVVRKELEPELKSLGITGEDSIGKVVNSFVHLGDAINGNSDDFNGALEGTIKLLQENANAAGEATRAYDGLLEAVESSLKAMQKSGSKVYINSTDKDGYRDGRYNYLLGEMSTIGKGFGGSKRFTTTDNTQQDFQEWAAEIQKETGLLGQAMVEAPGGMGFEYDFGKFVEILKQARAEADQLAQGGDRVKISFDDACGVIDAYADKIANAMKNFTQSEVTEESVSPMQRLLGTIKELEGVTIPDFSGLNALTTLAGKIGNEKGAAIGENLARIVESLRGISGDVTIPDFSSLQALGEGMQKLGLKSATQGAQNIPIIAKALTELSFAQIPSDFTSLAGLAEAIHALGLSSAQKAAQNIPQLAQALNDLITSLAEMPEVSDKTLRLVEALGQLDGANMKVANSTNHVAKGHNLAGQAIQKFTSRVSSAYNNSNFLATAYNKVKDGVSGFAQSMDKATSHTQSLTMVIVKARTLLWGFRRIFSMFSGSLELASSLVEVQNVIDNVFTENYAAKIEDMSKSVKDSLGMSELSFKQYASRYQAMGKAMGITNSQMVSAQDNLKGMGVAYGEANGNMQDMSVNLTRLAADLASFYDIDQKTAFEKLQAVYTGQTRPLNVAA